MIILPYPFRNWKKTLANQNEATTDSFVKIVIVEGWFVTSFDRHIDIFIPLVIKNVRKVPKRIFLANGFTLRDVSRNFLVFD